MLRVGRLGGVSVLDSASRTQTPVRSTGVRPKDCQCLGTECSFFFASCSLSKNIKEKRMEYDKQLNEILDERQVSF